MESNISFRSFDNKIALSLLVITIALFIGICIWFGFHLISKHNENVCTTKSCIKAAHFILENIDTSVDPCEDFHRFSCGAFLDSKRIPDDQTKIDVFDILRNNLAYSISDILSEEINPNDINATINAKKFYKSCINEDLLEEKGEEVFLKALDEEFGGWPILSGKPNAVKNNSSLIDRLVKLRNLNFRPLFDIFVTLNPKETQLLMLKIKQPNWFFNKHYYNETKFIKTYKNFIFNYIKFLNPNATDLNKQIDDLIETEKLFASFLTDEEMKRSSAHTIMTLRDLIEEIPLFDWKTFVIDGLFKDIRNVNMTLDEPIIVDDLNYLRAASEIFSKYEKHNKTALENLFVWSAIKNEVTFLPKKYKDLKQEFDKIYRGTKTTISRVITCSNYVTEVMEYAVGRLYVSAHFNNRSKHAATEMIENIRQEFIQLLKEADWLDDESRIAAIEKADNIDSKVAYPDFIYNDTYLNEIYEDYDMNETEYLRNSLKILKLDATNGFFELRTVRDRKTWISGPAVVNAFYSPFTNQICFPAGILQSPFYDSESPNYLNYGAIGTVIGHEITHGFDDRGRSHDKNGVFYADGATSLWTNTSIQNYKKRAECIINQYNNFFLQQINRTLNGKITQGENIADNGGLKESYRAYKRWTETNGPEPLLPGLSFNQDQLFFINYAQVWCTKYRSQSLLLRTLNSNHSPGEFRIIGPTSNSEDFANIFKCKPGQRNNPTNKCSVW